MIKIDLGIQQFIQNATYSCIMKTEVPEGINKDEFKQQLKGTLETMREAMQEDAAKAMATDIKALPAPNNTMSSQEPTVGKSTKKRKPACKSQLAFIRKFCNEHGIDTDVIARSYGAKSIEGMSGHDCWEFINAHNERSE